MDSASKTRREKHGRRARSTSSSASSTSSEDARREVKRLKKRLSQLERSVPKIGMTGSDETLVPIFDPQTNELPIEAWVSRVDDVAQFYKWNDRAVARVAVVAASRLRGMARRWYDSQQSLNVEWQVLKEVLIKQFHKPLPFSKLLLDAATYQAAPGQDLGEYCFEKLAKLKLLNVPIPQLYLIDAVIGGISDENIARSARSSNFQETTDLYAFLSTLGCVPDNKPTRDPNYVQLKKRPSTTDLSRPSGSGIIKRNISCFNCKKLGHIQSECPYKNAKGNNKEDH